MCKVLHDIQSNCSTCSFDFITLEKTAEKFGVCLCIMWLEDIEKLKIEPFTFPKSAFNALNNVQCPLPQVRML